MSCLKWGPTGRALVWVELSCVAGFAWVARVPSDPPSIGSIHQWAGPPPAKIYISYQNQIQPNLALASSLPFKYHRTMLTSDWSLFWTEVNLTHLNWCNFLARFVLVNCKYMITLSRPSASKYIDILAHRGSRVFLHRKYSAAWLKDSNIVHIEEKDEKMFNNVLYVGGG